MSSTTQDPLPNHWYLFFGVLEPISVLAGTVYATLLPERYNHELIPPAFLSSSKLQSSLLNAGVLTDSTRMALAQLGSCYFLIMLNSAILFYTFKRLQPSNPAVVQHLTSMLLVVLGAADWTHIGLTIALLPNGPPHQSGLVAIRKATFTDKLALLAKPASWNSLLFGNIVITFILFCFRAMWWAGVGRGRVSSSTSSTTTKLDKKSASGSLKKRV
ncbi:hypothetical protein BCV70DRAFT_197068 [Testicularia cyperi]|uniref:DUF7704 domain-containing protein n=1 Tax=Testicularia cyperi TaxID=1882483 RepID=A0A317XWW0_9BASI|nr:hypothetical protein BCV70DRAFT_197068 [Testicularia cyperi]